MIQDVCECLNVHGLEDDAYSVILSFGSAAEKEVDRYYLKASGNIVPKDPYQAFVRKIILLQICHFFWNGSGQVPG